MPVDPQRIAVLERIQERVLWLSANIINVANHHRNTGDGLKVGGHQASCASMVTLMTALYMEHLNAEDFVAVKPHGAPVLHAINYLLGGLDRSYLERLRQFGGLQAYPSRTKDPDRVDFSTGSVGLGPAATIFAAQTRSYVDAHFGKQPSSRFVAILGDAELDEGNIWEAVHDPQTHTLGKVTWLIDFNRQSLDRIVPEMRIGPWRAAFEAHGWQVIEVKYGRRLQRAFSQLGGRLLHDWIDAMPNEQYQSLFALGTDQVRARFLEGAPAELAELMSQLSDHEVASLVTDLGGHDMVSMLEALREADRQPDRPSVIFAYTHKGWGLPTQGSPRNHAAILTEQQIDLLRRRCGIPRDDLWARFDETSPAGRLLDERAKVLLRPAPDPLPVVPVPASSGLRASAQASTQEAFGRVLVNLARDEVTGPRIVTTSPDVATSTNLAGWINKTGVFNAAERREWIVDPLLSWHESPAGQHMELGISEMNFFGLLGQLGLSQVFSGQRLLPVGAVYDPFVVRGLDAFCYANYLGASFVVAGTPSGITLAPEGGAHQSSITVSIGIELPGVSIHEPAYAQEVDWLLCDALARVGASDGVHPDSHYLRLSTCAIDQAPFEAARTRLGDEELRRQVVAGGYLLRPAVHTPVVQIVASGVVMPQAVAAAEVLEAKGVWANVVNITSPSRLYDDWRAHRGTPGLPASMQALTPEVPVLTVQDASAHALAWVGAALGVRTASLGVDAFGQSGSVDELYQAYGLSSQAVVAAAQDLAGQASS